MINHYLILGAHAGMDDLQIKELYRAAARKHHPDRGGKAADFAAVTAAYAATRTPAARAGLAQRYALSAAPCGACSGFGYVVKMKGFTSSTQTPCTRCHGCGYSLETAASPRSVRKKK